MNIDKKLFRDGPYSDFFSQGVLVGNILTLAGQVGDGKDGEIPESIKEQMENCYDNIQKVHAIKLHLVAKRRCVVKLREILIGSNIFKYI